MKCMTDDQFMRLFQYVEETRKEVRDIADNMATKEDIRRLTDILDGIAGRLNDHDLEIAALVDTSRRHEDNLETLAKKLKVKLNAAKA